ncbi:hypothetical protein GSI_02187 [Ganoderma sinense ZZ0214-1]|uniref:DUF8212 domain-containing protein n=1 Tax=Ganoderma sinense ZZ0214-1 TaxID=1077348 RepID=A0A2G8SNY0_9APHY|nr:hypothetical protein GSI_02187 [Ganoderma sinense ZZ0214-1]
METEAELKEERKPWQWHLALLNCEHAELPGHHLGRVCLITPSDSSDVEVLSPGCVRMLSGSNIRLFPLSPDTIEQCHRAKRIELTRKTVYISHPHTLQGDGMAFTIDAIVEVSRPLLARSSDEKRQQQAFASRTVSWSDSHAWLSQLIDKSVALDGEDADKMTVNLSLKLATRELCFLEVELQ